MARVEGKMVYEHQQGTNCEDIYDIQEMLT